MAKILFKRPKHYKQRLQQRLSILLVGTNMSAKSIGDILNVSEDVIFSWIDKKRYPKAKYLGDIAKLCNVSVEYLLCRTDEITTISNNEIRSILYGRDLCFDETDQAIDLSKFTEDQVIAIVEFCGKIKNGDIYL